MDLLRKIVFPVATIVAAAFLIGEFAGLGLAPYLVNSNARVLDEQGRRHIQRRFMGGVPGEGPAISIVGTSLSGYRLEERTLATELKRLVGPSLQVRNETSLGVYLGDIFARLVDAAEDQVDLTLVEINPFSLQSDGEGRNRGIVRRRENVLPILEVEDWPMRMETLGRWGFGSVLSGELFRHSALFALGQLNRDWIRSNMKLWMLRPAGHEEWNGMTVLQHEPDWVQVFAGRGFRGRTDSRLMQEMLDWIARRQGARQWVIYFPPVHRKRMLLLCRCEQDGVWEDFERWRHEVVSACEARGIPAIDFTDLFEGKQAGYFHDVGHLLQPGYTALARALLPELRRVSMKTRPAGAM